MKQDTHKRKSNKHVEHEEPNNPAVNKGNSSGLNSMLLIAAGFVVVIFYTIWSSIKTYSDQLHYDMD
jgi:hypothetical protein